MTITIPRAVLDWAAFLLAVFVGHAVLTVIGLPDTAVAIAFGMAWGWWATKRGIL